MAAQTARTQPGDKLTAEVANLRVAIESLTTTVKMSISEQRRVNDSIYKDFEQHKTENRDDINKLWDTINKDVFGAIKENTNGIWWLRVVFASIGGLSLLAAATKLIGWW